MKKDLLTSPLVITFSKVPDPRVRKRCKYKLIEIIGIVICGVMSGCESWVEIEEFAQERKDWFAKFFALEDGLPSHDTLARCFSLIEASLFENLFRQWVESIKIGNTGATLAIDGKAVAGTHRGFNDGTYPLYLLNVLCHDSGLTFSQKRASGPGHGEIFAAEACLDQLMLQGTLVTMDAGLAVNRVASKINERGGDYLLPLKKNQRHSLKVIEDMFAEKRSKPITAKTHEKAHGREELRRCQVIKLRGALHPNLENWPGIKTAIQMDRERIDLKKQTKSMRTDFFISSRVLTSAEALQIIRGHWSIENKLHWTLDVAFREDSWRVRERIAAENLSLVRKICLNLLQKSEGKESKRVKMKKAGWNPDYLEKLLMNSSF
jgi:predicted transposase YbfD/YdcC